ncbi:MAG: hypothetical protein WCG01_03780 [bacterium]
MIYKICEIINSTYENYLGHHFVVIENVLLGRGLSQGYLQKNPADYIRYYIRFGSYLD